MIARLRANWQAELIYLGLAAMESCWLTPWLQFLLGTGVRRQLMPWVALFFTLLLALYLTRYMEARGASLLSQRLVTVAAALLCTLALLRIYVYARYAAGDASWLLQFTRELANVLQRIPPSLIVLCAGIYLWWRGVSLAQRDLDLLSAGFSFRMGIVAFFWLFLVRLLGTPVEATASAFLFFFLSLIVLGLSRVYEVSHTHASIRSAFDLWWLTILVGATLGVSALSVLAARLLSLRSVAALLAWLHPALELLGRVASPFLALLALLLDAVLRFLIRAFGVLFGEQSQESAELSRLAERLRQLEPVEVAARSLPLALRILGWAVLALLFCVGLAALAFSIDRRRRAREEARLAEHGLVWDSTDGGKDASRAWEAYWRNLRQELEARLARLRGQEYALASIRQIYSSLVKLSTAAGYPRQNAETPYEYLETLAGAFPESRDDLGLITEAYVRTHYGEQRFQPEYVRRVRDAWLAVRQRQAQATPG